MKTAHTRKGVPMAGNTQRTTARKAPRKKPSIHPVQFNGTLYIAGRRFQEVTGYPPGKPFPKDFTDLCEEHREAMKLLKLVWQPVYTHGRFTERFRRRLRKLMGAK